MLRKPLSFMPFVLSSGSGSLHLQVHRLGSLLAVLRGREHIDCQRLHVPRVRERHRGRFHCIPFAQRLHCHLLQVRFQHHGVIHVVALAVRNDALRLGDAERQEVCLRIRRDADHRQAVRRNAYPVGGDGDRFAQLSVYGRNRGQFG